MYLFDSRGSLAESKLLEGESVSLQVDPQKSYRIMVGPDLIEGEKSPPDLVAHLRKAGAVVQDVIPTGRVEALRIPVSRFTWSCWWKTCIVVHGTVRKLLNPGMPNPQYATVCKGIVQIFQVDLGCTLDKLASFQVLQLRNNLIDKISSLITQRMVVRPPFPPGPPPEMLASAMARSAPQASAAAAFHTTMMTRSMAMPTQQVQPEATTAKTSLAEVTANMSALEGTDLKKYIIANKAILWPFWCELIPDEWFCWQELGEVSIQSDGSFWAEVCFWCPDDFPDLYFEVVQNINGVDQEVWDPQIACNTYYNYDGSESVDIVLDDPAAVACLPVPPRPIPGDNLFVWPTAIGNQDLRNITDLETSLTSPGPSTGLLLGTTAWGGTLALQVVFDPNLKTMSNARYYRWSYKFDGDANFTPINATVTHRYMTITYGPLVITLNPVVLGPQTVGTSSNLFEIPDPVVGDGWVDINDPWDRPFGYFDSTGNGLPPFTYNDSLSRRSGMCTLMLEIFDNAGNLMPCGNLGLGGPFVFVLPDMSTSNKYTSVLTNNNITPQGQLIFRVHVDNADTDAELVDVKTPLGKADQCGFLHFSQLTDPVTIDYVAYQPRGFIDWWLGVYRGLYGLVVSTSGATSAGAPGTPVPFTNTASTLLGGCNKAAFAVNLDCWARITDGYGRQSQYDRYATIAFALTQ